MKRKKVLFIFGTRPEAIKMAPIVLECLAQNSLETKVCITGQHKEMLQQVLDFFQIVPDYDLSLMQHNQTLFDLTANALKGIESILNQYDADVILVQGDTTTAMVGALAGFYKKIPVAHVEAGLRSGDIYSPFPEEVNRRIISSICTFHFVPTEMSYNNLIKENHRDHIYLTGNSVIDALLLGVQKVRNAPEIADEFIFLDTSKKIILVTAHRRESFGEPFVQICNALLEIATRHPDVQIIYPVHLNPNVQEVVHNTLSALQNVFLIKPVSYPQLIWLLDKSYLVLTDSGGIQEEAPSLGKPVLVMREVTERMEGVEAGTALLVGTRKDAIVEATNLLLTDKHAYQKMAKAVNPYGDGTSGKKIVSILIKS
jgi:UDP-N-acetylglucosamine 2-epimerase (non-hydrolysing)